VELAADASTPPSTGESREVPLPQPAEATKTTATASATDVAEVDVGEAGPSPPHPVAVGADEVRVPVKPAAAVQERVASEGTTRTASPEIQEAEEAGAALLQGAASGEAQPLELACSSWAATSEFDDDVEDDEEVAARNTLERGLNWARRAFDELILPATSVSFLV
jgi:hypothetical protein